MSEQPVAVGKHRYTYRGYLVFKTTGAGAYKWFANTHGKSLGPYLTRKIAMGFVDKEVTSGREGW